MKAKLTFHAEPVRGFDPGEIAGYHVGHVITTQSGAHPAWFSEPRFYTPAEVNEVFGISLPDRVTNIDDEGG